MTRSRPLTPGSSKSVAPGRNASIHIAEPVVECDQPANIEWAIYHLRNDAPPAIEGEGGEFTTLKVAMTLRGYGMKRAPDA